MTESEQEREIGRIVKERQTHVTAQVCAQNKARRFAKILEAHAVVLSAVADGEHWGVLGFDGYPSADDIRELLSGVAETFKRFLYLWICQAGIVAKTGRGTVLLKLLRENTTRGLAARLAGWPRSDLAQRRLLGVPGCREQYARNLHRWSFSPSNSRMNMLISQAPAFAHDG